MRATNHNTAFDGQPVKTFVFYIHVNQIFVPSIKHLAKKSGRTQMLNRYEQCIAHSMTVKQLANREKRDRLATAMNILLVAGERNDLNIMPPMKIIFQSLIMIQIKILLMKYQLIRIII